jgi:hypothetical protein
MRLPPPSLSPATRCTVSRDGLDAWLAARAKSIADSEALAAMSERELRDIGLDPARIHGAAHGYPRDLVS